ncbi:MAG: Rdx family protein [Planctomycetes bacterium]|nr:Rdx family protein [Planctomycetota bacterium]
MADELKQSFDVDPFLEEGSGGVFLVELDGTVIFDKSQAGRFPEEGEIPPLCTSAP